MSYFQKAKDWTRKQLKQNLIDVTGFMCESNIIFSAYEQFCGMTDTAGYLNRAIITASAYSGMGYLCSKLSEVSDRILKIDRSKKQSKKEDGGISLHDAIYAGIFTTGMNTFTYWLTNNVLSENPRDFKEIVGMGLVAGGISALNGPAVFFSRDMFRDLVGYKECGRYLYPELIKNRSQKVKRALAVGFVVGSLALTGTIIECMPSKGEIVNYFSQTKAEASVSNLEGIVNEGNLEIN